ncbi:hypothetical protein SDC9_197730 [bioreactor metagenome]|uniref:Uncharacterized protein n=1 Tax=bioreactor metagenome TaxID=1076179 RepID=A0A645IP33_9ZZZZ
MRWPTWRCAPVQQRSFCGATRGRWATLSPLMWQPASRPISVARFCCSKTRNRMPATWCICVVRSGSRSTCALASRPAWPATAGENTSCSSSMSFWRVFRAESAWCGTFANAIWTAGSPSSSCRATMTCRDGFWL